tara:strand:+ start:1880 stop:2623 length:744 start_codon:yes stop_codon:yes gene_type:complete
MSKNKYTIYGINNCVTFLSNKNDFILVKIFINQNSPAFKNDKINALLDNYNDKISYLDNQLFNKKFPFKHSQGIYLEFEGIIEKNIDELINDNKNSCFLIIDQVKDPQNLGQIIRTSECAGVDGIILPRHNSVHLTNVVLQVSQGAFIFANICIENNIVNTIKFLQSNGYWIVGIENSIESKKWFEMDYKGKIGIVVGSEGKGIRKLVKESCDFLATIPMNGKINSLNVTAAISAILFERNRQLLDK